MKRRQRVLLLLPLLLLLFAASFQWGCGSSSAAADLREELEALHGRPYAGRVLSAPEREGRAAALREDLAFTVEPAGRLAPRPWLAVFLGRPYAFSCRAVYTRTLLAEDGQVLETARQVYACHG